MQKSLGKNYFIFAITVVLVGLNLRPIMASIGPILDSIQHDTGIGDTTAGLLTTLPVLAMGIFALLGGLLQRRFGVEATVTAGLIAIGVGSAARVLFPTEVGLIATAGVSGIGIAVIQAVLPGLIKRDFSAHAGRLMALYTVGIMGGAMIASGSVAPIAEAMGWAGSLGVWAVLAVVAGVAWGVVCRSNPAKAAVSGRSLPVASPRAWYLLAFFGIGTSAYTLVLAWLPPFYVQLGWSPAASGLLLGGLTFAQVVAAVGLSSIVDRFPDRRPLLYAILLVIAAGFLCLVIAPQPLALPALILLGFGIGGLFPMSLIIVVDHLQDASQAGALMGFVQGGGYIVASVMPFVGGLLRATLHDLSSAWAIMAGGVVVLLLMVPALAPSQSLSQHDWTLEVSRTNK